VNREVVLERLKPEFAADAEAVRDFRALVRARAAVDCPVIAAVYEVQERDGAVFYTRELVNGRSLAEIRAAGQRIPAVNALQVLHGAADALGWLGSRRIPRESFTPAHVFHGEDGTVRVANLAASGPVAGTNESGEIRSLATVLMAAADFRSAGARELSHLLALMKAAGGAGVGDVASGGSGIGGGAAADCGWGAGRGIAGEEACVACGGGGAGGGGWDGGGGDAFSEAEAAGAVCVAGCVRAGEDSGWGVSVRGWAAAESCGVLD
jgi:hypothetical protein